MCRITAILSLTDCHALNRCSTHLVSKVENRLKQENEAHERCEPNGEAVSTQEQMNGSLNAIKHRGPDSNGSWVSADGKVGMLSCHELA